MQKLVTGLAPASAWWSQHRQSDNDVICCCLQEEARLLRMALEVADSELAAHQEIAAAGDVHAAAGRQYLVDLLQPVQTRQQQRR